MAQKFDKGVSFYTNGKVVLDVHFPEKDIICAWCPFCRSESDLNRYWCRLTNKMIYSPYSGLADGCPIIFDEEVNER